MWQQTWGHLNQGHILKTTGQHFSACTDVYREKNANIPWNLLRRLVTSSTASFAAWTGSDMICWMSGKTSKKNKSSSVNWLVGSWAVTLLCDSECTRYCFVFHKVKHDHTHNHPGQESSQGHQQLHRQLQLPEELQSFRSQGAGVGCSSGPSRCAHRGGFGCCVWKKPNI